MWPLVSIAQNVIFILLIFLIIAFLVSSPARDLRDGHAQLGEDRHRRVVG
jgi:hypothetical protein